MKVFTEKIKEERKEKGMTIADLAADLGISSRAVSYYEAGQRVPSTDIINKLCEIFEKPYEYFVSTEDDIVLQAAQRFGRRGKTQAEKIIQEANALFAGGELNEADKDLFLKAMETIYIESKERAKKYTPKKYLDSNE